MSAIGTLAATASLAITTSATVDRSESSQPVPAALARVEQAVPTETGRTPPLAGMTVVVDPGHQLGNGSHWQPQRLVDAGGLMKACNTTGTATNAGFSEATFTWRVANAVRRQLERRGAAVHLTRNSNSRAKWGPCVDTRGRTGNRVSADAVVSIHADGAGPSTRGFFVISPAARRGWTTETYGASHRLALDVRAGLRSTGVRTSNGYGGDGLDVRGDLGTLNWSDRPIVMVELGNMRNGIDAQHMTTPKYRTRHYAAGLTTGIKRFLLRR